LDVNQFSFRDQIHSFICIAFNLELLRSFKALPLKENILVHSIFSTHNWFAISHFDFFIL